jgi:hypothetical protein
MLILDKLADSLTHLKDEPRLLALMIITLVVAIVLAVVAGGALPPLVFGIIFFGLAIILLIAGVVSVGFVTRRHQVARRVTEASMETVSARYPMV